VSKTKGDKIMSNDFIDSLLADIPAEEVSDKRLGTHDNAVFASDVAISTNEYEGKLLYSLVAKFKITDQEGNDAIVQQNISLPDKDAPNGYKQQLLSWLHAFGIVARDSKNAPVLPTDAGEEVKQGYVEKIAAAFNTKVGEVVPIVVYQNKKGFVTVRAGKATK
jgi:hypothetical protein